MISEFFSYLNDSGILAMIVVYLDICMAFAEVNCNSILTKLGCYRLEVCSMRLVKKIG